MMTPRTFIQLVLILAFATAPLLQAAPVAMPVAGESAPAAHAGHDHHAQSVDHAHSESRDEHAASHASHSDCHGGGESDGGSCSSCVGCGIPLSCSSFQHAPATDYFADSCQWLEIEPESEQRPPKRIFS